MNKERKEHWEQVYIHKNPNEVSWTQEKPQTSLSLIAKCLLPKSAKIIDIGGGDSKLVDYLLAEGYKNISVLDISAKAIEKAQKRLGALADKVTWIVSDVVDFKPNSSYDLWHDRATFHFLTSDAEIKYYQSLVSTAINKHLIIGSFSENGPLKCSGLNIKQYDEISMTEVFKIAFEKIHCQKEDHTTPFGTTQNFVFCSFLKKQLKTL